MNTVLTFLYALLFCCQIHCMQQQHLQMNQDYFAQFAQHMPQSLLQVAPGNKTILEYYCDKATQEATNTPPNTQEIVTTLHQIQQALTLFRKELSTTACNPEHNQENTQRLILFKKELVKLKQWAESADRSMVESKKFDTPITTLLCNGHNNGISQQIYLMAQCARLKKIFPQDPNQSSTTSTSHPYAFTSQ